MKEDNENTSTRAMIGADEVAPPRKGTETESCWPIERPVAVLQRVRLYPTAAGSDSDTE